MSSVLLAVAIYIIYVDVLHAASTPLGQNPSITYAPESYNPFLILNGAKGLESVYCADEKCGEQYKQTIKSGVQLLSSSLIGINTRTAQQNCSKIINNKLYYCSYYIVAGYSVSNHISTINIVSFMICYDDRCNAQFIDTINIEESSDSSHLFGYSTSLSTYYNYQQRHFYPMFTYSKYNSYLKRYILNIIVCQDYLCKSWIGHKQQSPPYLILGFNPYNNLIAKGAVSIQETWYDENNYLSVMYTKNVNLSNINEFGLTVASCSLSNSNGAANNICNNLVGRQLESKLIFKNQGLKINDISMVRYPVSQQNVPIMITSYIVNNGKIDELYLLYCFNIFCNSIYKLSYKVQSWQQIDSPVISVHYQYYTPSIAFFADSHALMVMSCEYKPAPWNCTSNDYNHPTYALYEDSKFITSSMQISLDSSPYSWQQSVILFSMVQEHGVFNGSEYINCITTNCNINQKKHIQ